MKHDKKDVKLLCVKQYNFSLHRLDDETWEERLWLIYGDGLVLFRENCGSGKKRVIQYHMPLRKIKELYLMLKTKKCLEDNDGYDGSVWSISCADEHGKMREVFYGYADTDKEAVAVQKSLLNLLKRKKGDVIINEI